ncbi:MAG: hypothetical protein IJY44_04255 [Bacteroidaceae bacterium]|nr:hypothetical protein [Bacteroidaceae bacterium]
MNTKILLTIQLISFIAMTGTAERLFSAVAPTVIFLLSFIAFVRCSIYINKNEKWLLNEGNKNR